VYSNSFDTKVKFEMLELCWWNWSIQDIILLKLICI